MAETENGGRMEWRVSFRWLLRIENQKQDEFVSVKVMNFNFQVPPVESKFRKPPSKTGLEGFGSKFLH